MNAAACPPPVLTIAGSDCSAGAGIQADLKSITAMGGYGLTALTSVVSETPGRVSMVRLLDSALITDQVRVLFDGFPIVAAKMGMVGGLEQVETVAAVWREQGASRGVPLVVDPVMVATGGGRLLEEDAISAVRDLLLPQALVITPNMDEAEVLWGRPVTTRDEMRRCAEDLAQTLGTAVLVKGGHLCGAAAADVLYDSRGVEWFEAPRVEGVHTHGTGCSYSAAIATGLGLGRERRQAVGEAKAFIARAISQHFEWQSESGGVVHALNHLNPHP